MTDEPFYALAREPLTDALITEGLTLLRENWITSGSFTPEIALDPDFDLYKRLDKTGHLLVMTARDEGKLVGYAVLQVGMSTHHRSIKCAKGEAFYVNPSYRRLAGALLQAAENELVAVKVQRIGWFVVKTSPAYAFFRSRGFEEDEVVLEKVMHVPGH